MVEVISDSNMIIEIGTRTAVSVSNINGIKQAIEFAIWDVALNDNEIESISKVSQWHLRYDFSDDKLRWYNVPYTNHLSDYKYINDKVSVVNQRINTTFKATVQHIALGRAELYGNYHDSLLFGRYIPGVSIYTPFKIEESVLKPMQAFPMLQKKNYNTSR